MKTMRRILSVALGSILGFGVLPQAHADNYPTKPIRIIIPFAVGGSNDLVGRALQKPLSKALNGTVVIENLPGASTKIGLDAVANAAPDGYTLLFASLDSTMAYYYSGAFENKVWDQFVLLGRSGQMPWAMLEARADAPFKGWSGLVEYAKKNPKGVTVGGPASGGMMNLIALEAGKAAGSESVYVPFKGGGPSGLAMLGGHIDYRVAQPSEVVPAVKSGKTQALAVAFPSRLPDLPDVPTFREIGVGIEVPIFGFDLWGPPKLPAALAARLTAAMEAATKDPEFVEIAKRMNYQPLFVGPAELKRIAAEFERSIGPKLLAAFPPEPKK